MKRAWRFRGWILALVLGLGLALAALVRDRRAREW